MSGRLTDQERYYRQVSEAAVLAAVLRYLEARGVYAWRQNTGAAKTEAGGFVRFSFPGCSDVLGIGPGGRLWAVETKKEIGKVSDQQRAFLDAVAARGGVALVCRPSDYEAQIEQALGGA